MNTCHLYRKYQNLICSIVDMSVNDSFSNIEDCSDTAVIHWINQQASELKSTAMTVTDLNHLKML